MKVVQLTRTFLKKPLYSVALIVGVALLVEGLSWTSAFDTKIKILNSYGGAWPYVSLLLRGLILPEVCTACILVFLVNQHHIRFGIHSVELTPRAIGLYQLSLLPTVLLSFFIFNPITETVRFLLEQYPAYTFSVYWKSYVSGTFSWDIYFRYLIPVLLISYLPVNISLLSDYSQQRQQAQEAAEAKAAQAVQEAQAVIAARASSSSVPAPTYLASLKGKNSHGELDFPVEDVFYFTIEERYYYAELAKGRYLVAKTLNDLEAELDPSRFFRIKRDYIVNRTAVLNYAYWENGKYIVRLNTPDRYEIVVPRARMQIFREWLQGSQQPLLDEAGTGPFMLTA
ncbi:LytTR family transcriptional regulator [Spirosoma taeanense]|uniref:LytTR family transcriptional regulator n=1 Tax=Spirosoma taeanense TaxID=2735870 RepID=A0A6M5YBR7_9BACT|nr:LytTR family DNA-binding domain-containing protein [Spirosoma taeanense]QJW91409.1 LytTR family transcriptional regulator [Spirosoma taeanense]